MIRHICYAPDCLLSAATVQIPFEIVLNRFSGPPSTDITTTQVTFTENGISSKAFQLWPVGANIHVLTTCTTRVVNPQGLPCMPLVTHADGSMVYGPFTNFDKGPGLAKPGEELVMYAVGLGMTMPTVKSGQPTPISGPSGVTGIGIVFDYSANASPQNPGDSIFPYAVPAFVGLTPGFVGLYQVNFVVPQPPPGTLPCLSFSGRETSNLTVSIGAGPSFDGARICVDTETTP